MKRGVPLFLALGSLLLGLLVVVSAVAILNACQLNFPLLRHLSSCDDASRMSVMQRTDTLAEQRSEFERRIFELERELAALQCVVEPLDPTAPLTPEGWANGDLRMLNGCWDLDATYRTRDVDSGAIRTYGKWQMCFDGAGAGRQVMQADDGAVCEGPIRAEFAEDRLSLIEPGNLSCDDGGYIHQRTITCGLAEGGAAICDTLQPETKGAAKVGFQRAR